MTQALRILHVIDSLAPGGAERMLVDLANECTRRGCEVHVCATRASGPLEGGLHPKVFVTQLRRRSRFDGRGFVGLAKLMQAQPFDVIHAHGRSSFSFLTLSKSVLPHVPAILLHDHFGRIELDDSVPLWFALFGYRLVAQYVGVSESLARWAIRAGVSPSRVTVIENALDLTRIDSAAPVSIRAELDIPPERPLGIAVAGLREEKGIDVLIDAVARTSARDHFVVLVVGGDRDPEYAARCRARVIAAGLSSSIRFLGERVDVPSLLKSVDFGLLPSQSESGPLVLIEFGAAALPVVSTRVGEIGRRLAASEVEGFVEPGDPPAFAAAIDRLLGLSTEARRARGLALRAAVESRFGVRAVAPRWIELYESVRRRS